jgi:hypothetical protein
MDAAAGGCIDFASRRYYLDGAYQQYYVDGTLYAGPSPTELRPAIIQPGPGWPVGSPFWLVDLLLGARDAALLDPALHADSGSSEYRVVCDLGLAVEESGDEMAVPAASSTKQLSEIPAYVVLDRDRLLVRVAADPQVGQAVTLELFDHGRSLDDCFPLA